MSFKKETNSFGTFSYRMDSEVVLVSFCGTTSVPKI